MTYVCPHCDAVIVFLCEDVRKAECDCGGLMEPLHVSEQLGPALDLSDPAQLDVAIAGVLAER